MMKMQVANQRQIKMLKVQNTVTLLQQLIAQTGFSKLFH